VEVLQGLGGNGRESGWGGAGMEIKSAETGWIGVISTLHVGGGVLDSSHFASPPG